ncbi:ABC transporter ATP-binding protein [Cohnella abietis]|uniref:Nitrate/sulfonate/bicarbonate ABC transporter ATP-binding protein n=1 Tax=Cohnella abietis TaxID=2507935 RepID=A0A3T1D2D6_9BACL|nr:ABC transporter ATP-binding protein [Cohnella abietis]BBI32201.1 nitrate/sulfonate/bicarbonate ABC transporter ATP-binding protein [Cohnella abietis]
MEVLGLKNVSKTYRNGTVAVQEANLSIHEGEFVSFVGPSGCGKSTIFRMAAGLSQPTAGQIDILGGTPEQARTSNSISCVFQEATLLPWVSVSENITLPLQLRKQPRKQQLEEAERVLQLVGLQDYAKALPRELSGGMKMRVSIARALVAKPKILFMDEPFGALDEITRQTLQEELLTIWQKTEQMTILFVTHNAFEAVYLSNRIMVMTPRPGRISDEIAINIPYPRGEQFRAHSDFSNYVRQVSESLRH